VTSTLLNLLVPPTLALRYYDLSHAQRSQREQNDKPNWMYPIRVRDWMALGIAAHSRQF